MLNLCPSNVRYVYVCVRECECEKVRDREREREKKVSCVEHTNTLLCFQCETPVVLYRQYLIGPSLFLLGLLFHRVAVEASLSS